MLKNYLKIAFRTLWKNKKLSLINIFGLATGMACSLLIFLFILDELSFDKHHRDASRIYRVVKDFINDDGSRIPDATSPGPLAPAMKREIPEVEEITRVHPNWGGTTLIQNGDKRMAEARVMRVDSSFFKVFTVPFLKGNSENALHDINSIVLTKSTAERYFGNDDPIGKVLNLGGQNDVTVTGVVEDVPAQSHFHYDFLLSYRRLPAAAETNWNNYNYYTYVKVREGTDIATFENKIQELHDRNIDNGYSDFYTQALTDIHLTSRLKWELEPNGDRMYVDIFTIVGIFVLLIAAINYVNLSTAKTSLRAKETGIRKVSGAQRKSLIFQFLLESVIICALAGFLALSIAYALLPVVNELTQKQLSMTGSLTALIYLFVASGFVAVVAGLFPAFYLSSFQPVAVLKGLKGTEGGALSLRRTLVVVQFTISIALIIGAFIIVRQMDFIRSAKLGFDKEQMLVVRNLGNLSPSHRNVFLNAVKDLPGVENAAASAGVIGQGFNTTRLRAVGSEQSQQLNFASVDYEYLDVVGIEMTDGRSFSKIFPADTLNNGIFGGPLDQRLGGIIVNEQAVKEFGLGDFPVGKSLVWATDGDTTYFVEVVGVAKNFHFTSLRNEIKPFGFLLDPRSKFNLTAKLQGDRIAETVAQIERLWKDSFQDSPFEYTFMDETFGRMYAAESRFQKVFVSLMVLAIIIACLGLFALAAFSTEQRIREIGIRKVLGATAGQVVALLSKDFIKLVLIAVVLSIPLSYYAMAQWLDGFAYRVPVSWWIYVAAAATALLIAFVTVSAQAIKAAITNPAKSLKSE